MKIFRKMQRQVEMKIRYAMATGKLPCIERSSVGEVDTKLDSDKAAANGSGSSK